MTNFEIQNQKTLKIIRNIQKMMILKKRLMKL